MAENHRQLARVGMSAIGNGERPAASHPRCTHSRRCTAGGRRSAHSRRMLAQPAAKTNPRTEVRRRKGFARDGACRWESLPSPVDVAESILLNGAREFYRPSAFLGTPARRIAMQSHSLADRSSESVSVDQGNERNCATQAGLRGEVRLSAFVAPESLTCRRSFRPLGRLCGLCLERVFRPGVFGIAAAKVFSDLVIGGGPEAPQVVGDLDRPVVRAENVQQDGHPPPGHSRGFGPAEQFLKTHGQDRRPAGFVSRAAPVVRWARRAIWVHSRAARGSGRGSAGFARTERDRFARPLRAAIFPGRRVSSSSAKTWSSKSGQSSSGSGARTNSTRASHCAACRVVPEEARGLRPERLGQMRPGELGSVAGTTSSRRSRS